MPWPETLGLYISCLLGPLISTWLLHKHIHRDLSGDFQISPVAGQGPLVPPVANAQTSGVSSQVFLIPGFQDLLS